MLYLSYLFLLNQKCCKLQVLRFGSTLPPMRCIPVSVQWPYFYHIQLHAAATIAFEFNFKLRIGGQRHRYERKCVAYSSDHACTTICMCTCAYLHLQNFFQVVPISSLTLRHSLRLIIAAIVAVTVETNCLQSTASLVSIPKLFRDLNLCSCLHSIFNVHTWIAATSTYCRTACIYGFTILFLRLRGVRPFSFVFWACRQGCCFCGYWLCWQQNVIIAAVVVDNSTTTTNDYRPATIRHRRTSVHALVWALSCYGNARNCYLNYWTRVLCPLPIASFVPLS